MRIAVVAAAMCLSVIGLSVAQDVRAAIRQPTNIPAQSLSSALKSLATERGFQILFITNVVGDTRTEGAVGELTPTEALGQLLTGTAFTYRFLDENTVTIVPVNHGGSSEAPIDPIQREGGGATGTSSDTPEASADKPGLWKKIRLAQIAGGSSANSTNVEVSSDQGSPSDVEKKGGTGGGHSDRHAHSG